MKHEMRASFGAEEVDEAWRVAWRVHLEELLLGRLSAETLGHYIQIEGSLPSDRGVVLVYPHAGNVMLMIAALAFSGHRYVQFAARGLAPPEVAAANPETFGHNRWREAVRTVREADEDRVPAEYVTHPRGLVRALKDGAVVGIAYDGRLGSRFEPVPYLGRTALLSTGPWKLARKTGAALVPAFNLCPPDGPNRLLLGPPVQGRDEALDWLQARLREHPGHYGLWLTHCRERRAVDDHPLFVDYAPDDRWRRWESAP
jgi:lauroyl/myristoyl acyltransferase